MLCYELNFLTVYPAQCLLCTSASDASRIARKYVSFPLTIHLAWEVSEYWLQTTIFSLFCSAE